MSSFNLSEYISYILINNENTSSGKEPTPVKSTLLPGQAQVIVVASLPTNPSRDVMLKIPIGFLVQGIIAARKTRVAPMDTRILWECMNA